MYMYIYICLVLNEHKRHSHWTRLHDKTFADYNKIHVIVIIICFDYKIHHVYYILDACYV
jgi:hypothetical protein